MLIQTAIFQATLRHETRDEIGFHCVELRVLGRMFVAYSTMSSFVFDGHCYTAEKRLKLFENINYLKGCFSIFCMVYKNFI